MKTFKNPLDLQKDIGPVKGVVGLETRDGYIVHVDFALLLRSRVIQHMYLSTNISTEKNPILPILGINHEPLLMILLWLEYHKNDEEPDWVEYKEEPNNFERYIDSWDKEFLRDDISTIRCIMLGADYLDLPWLVKLCAHKLQARALPEFYLNALTEICPLY